MSRNKVRSDGVNSDLAIDLQQLALDAAEGIRDLEDARKAAEDVDRIRERNRHLFGDAPIGVSIIREFRGELPE